MDTESRESAPTPPSLPFLERLERLSKIFAAVVLPIVLAGLANWYSEHQRTAEHHERVRMQLLQLSDYLFDSDPRKRMFAGGVMEMMENEGTFIPRSLMNLVVATYNAADQDQDQESTGGGAATETGKPQKATAADATVSAATAAALGGLAPRLFIHITEESQRPNAERLRRAIQQRPLASGALIIAPSVQRVSNSPSSAELRFLKQTDHAEAGEILLMLKTMLDLDIRLVDLSKNYDKVQGVKGRTYELWLPKGAFAHSD